ncbi:hypothetical protein LZF95_10215 [Algoriphagus sp. AGSA1]|uniref:undecaprenyl-diphosphate phosphatase n=1 Tax=Algoriphagus sp. AGSA1 TaxID=2907213 RepID=UPI001F196539|nr:undecaprenyl-diphosphate phosphatase [Algoriphagus sp. AGSA1]MCE7055048.1 hypothetical protein [Algoriphagus sp. AGSA1]
MKLNIEPDRPRIQKRSDCYDICYLGLRKINNFTPLIIYPPTTFLFMTITQSIIIAIIEGLTEFLPVSSTGHMILASAAMNIHEEEFVKTFEIFIQSGAILAIALMYINRFVQGVTIYIKLLAAFIPTAIIGLLAYDYIKAYLFNPIVVSVSLIIGGFVLIFIDKKVKKPDKSF